MAKSREKDYLAIARRSVTRPSLMHSKRSILVYGRNKKGKSNFALSGGVAKTLVLDPPESGIEHLKIKNPYLWPILKWEDMADAILALRTGKLSPAELGVGPEKEPFTIVSPDGWTAFHDLAMNFVRRQDEAKNLERQPGHVSEPDYGKSGVLVKTALNQLHSLPMHVIHTCQERMVSLDSGDSDEDEESTFFVADLPKGVRAHIYSLAQVIGRIYVVRINTKDGLKPQRRLQIGPHERYDSGYRSEFVLPDMLKMPTFPKLVKLMEEGEL